MVNVCMISDFFYPSMGGVENHVYQLSQCLLMQGHKVVVVTHRYGQRCGVRWLPRGLKVYYLPFCGVHDRVVLPTGLMLLPLLRDVLIRERITMVHAHAVCTMALEAVTLCSLMGYRVVYTEHSNFGMSSPTDINLNSLERIVLSLADTVGPWAVALGRSPSLPEPCSWALALTLTPNSDPSPGPGPNANGSTPP